MQDATSQPGNGGSQRGPVSAPRLWPGLCTQARLTPDMAGPRPRARLGEPPWTPSRSVLCSQQKEESENRAGISRPAAHRRADWLGPQEPRQAATAPTRAHPSGHSLTAVYTTQQLWLQGPAGPWERMCPSVRRKAALSPSFICSLTHSTGLCRFGVEPSFIER